MPRAAATILLLLLLASCTTHINPRDNYIEREQITLKNGELTIKGLEEAKLTTFKGTTHSMHPTISNTTQGIYTPIKHTDIQVGDIISFYSPAENTDYAHRVIAIGTDEQGWYAKTKGDNQQPDKELVREKHLKGVIVLLIY